MLGMTGIAAEEGDRRLGGEDQADILVAAILVQVVDAAVIEADHVAAQSLAPRKATRITRRPTNARVPLSEQGGSFRG